MLSKKRPKRSLEEAEEVAPGDETDPSSEEEGEGEDIEAEGEVINQLARHYRVTPDIASGIIEDYMQKHEQLEDKAFVVVDQLQAAPSPAGGLRVERKRKETKEDKIPREDPEVPKLGLDPECYCGTRHCKYVGGLCLSTRRDYIAPHSAPAPLAALSLPTPSPTHAPDRVVDKLLARHLEACKLRTKAPPPPSLPPGHRPGSWCSYGVS